MLGPHLALRWADVRDAVALLNAGRRGAAHDIETALRVLEEADSPADIAHGRSRDHDRLRGYRAEVRAELRRWFGARPAFAGELALLRIGSPAEVHPLLARRWARRLPEHVVVVANDGYLPGRVAFAVRTQHEEDLERLLRASAIGWHVGSLSDARGGVLAQDDFDRLLAALGFGRR